MDKFEPVMPGRKMPQPIDVEVTRRTGQETVLPISENTVLRNTYRLLALTMLPTIAGAFVGIQLNFFAFFQASPIMAPLLMLGLMLGSLFVVTALRNSGWGVVALFGFTFIAGLALTPILTVALGLRNGGQLIGLAGGMTAVIFFALSALVTITKKDFSFMGKFLFVGLILLLVAMVANLFFQVPAASVALSAIAVLIFSGYILFDVSRIVHGGETNYIMATMSLFLNIYNIFVSLLNILMAFTGSRD
jgi:FtsH-binding integral membrane protein